MAELRLLSWNVAGRVRLLPEQADVVAGVRADVVCLQEVTPTTVGPWRRALADAGLSEVRTSLDDWLPGEPPPDGRRLGVVTAARWPLRTVSVAHPPWAERLLSVRVETPTTPFELHNLHSPISQKPDRVKLRTHRALHAALARPRDVPALVAGDLNTPRRELADGETWSFARDARGRLRPDRGEEWEQAELALLRGLEPYGVRDLFRELHGYERDELSWRYPRRRSGYRLDHLIGSSEFEPISLEYLHAALDTGLSDHAPLVAELALGALFSRAVPG
jgi:endonuclease/exonuclease/phosphatase family metal-dependent hydrolase